MKFTRTEMLVLMGFAHSGKCFSGASRVSGTVSGALEPPDAQLQMLSSEAVNFPSLEVSSRGFRMVRDSGQ